MAIVPIWDYTLNQDNMRIIALSRPKAFWEVHQDAKAPSLTWYRVVYIRFIGTHEAYDRIDARKI